MQSTTQSRRYTIVFVLGPPGSGKGTLCKLAAAKLDILGYNYRHLSVGDYLRELCELESPDYDEIRDHLRAGKLLSAEALIPLLEHKISSATTDNNATTAWLIDGFPRSMETALAFEEKIGKPVKVVALECARDTAQGRFLRRGREKSDDEGRFGRRYDEYVQNMKAIREHYASIAGTVRVDGTREECLGEFVRVLPSVPMDAER